MKKDEGKIDDTSRIGPPGESGKQRQDETDGKNLEDGKRRHIRSRTPLWTDGTRHVTSPREAEEPRAALGGSKTMAECARAVSPASPVTPEPRCDLKEDLGLTRSLSKSDSDLFASPPGEEDGGPAGRCGSASDCGAAGRPSTECMPSFASEWDEVLCVITKTYTTFICNWWLHLHAPKQLSSEPPCNLPPAARRSLNPAVKLQPPPAKRQ
ncbi:Ankyrin repeat and SAM domain-containing protein 1A [Liparis tanakae]|uniref:Ankyrin repeat and SAM domain-containing protein 1A n=1 Tax=Liparis tanakae TaxID=230148 RepID=A0A4Z2G2V9_9TELE|nr:Ankyrin repeat and SAM domain-containing protein 1A [Liparis tanakae]